jgi:hypothetical protein
MVTNSGDEALKNDPIVNELLISLTQYFVFCSGKLKVIIFPQMIITGWLRALESKNAEELALYVNLHFLIRCS